MGYEDPASIDLPAGKLVLHILLQTALEASPVFLADTHLPLVDLNARPDLQKVGAFDFKARAASALIQVIKVLYYKTGVDLGRRFFKLAADLLRFHAFFRHARGIA